MIATKTYQPSSYAPDSSTTALTARLSKLARQALIAEADLTPKPGLVDCRGQGAHTDLDLSLMHLSARVLEPYFAQMAQACAQRLASRSVFEELRRIGRSAEKAMLHATGGTNTHKGAVWSLGLLVAATSMHEPANHKAFVLAATAGNIASFHDQVTTVPVTHGYQVEQEFAVSGARGEAKSAFPHVMGFGLPTLRLRRTQGACETTARLDCLLSIMSHLDDTCLLYRGGKQALAQAQAGALDVLAAGGAGTPAGRRQLRLLDERLVQQYWSPGGSADLLAATLFIDALDRGVNDIECSSAVEET